MRAESGENCPPGLNGQCFRRENAGEARREEFDEECRDMRGGVRNRCCIKPLLADLVERRKNTFGAQQQPLLKVAAFRALYQDHRGESGVLENAFTNKASDFTRG